jgi:hypothetical protein
MLLFLSCLNATEPHAALPLITERDSLMLLFLSSERYSLMLFFLSLLNATEPNAGFPIVPERYRA